MKTMTSKTMGTQLILISLLSGFRNATAQSARGLQAQPAGTCPCKEADCLTDPPPYSGMMCTTTTTTFTVGSCEDEPICVTLVGLCECLAFGLREKVRKNCPLMCNLCTTTSTGTTTTTTSTTTTTTTTTTKQICEDQIQCPTRQGTCDCDDKCNHPLVGPRLQLECPVMCGLCGSTTTMTTTTTTTTTTRDPVICADHPSCPNQQASYIKDGTG